MVRIVMPVVHRIGMAAHLLRLPGRNIAAAPTGLLALIPSCRALVSVTVMVAIVVAPVLAMVIAIMVTVAVMITVMFCVSVAVSTLGK
jgi:hypothetical protein